jgi:hypothetical protein
MEMMILVLFHIWIVLVDDAKRRNDDHYHVLDEDQLHLEEKLEKRDEFHLLEMFEYTHPIIHKSNFRYL